MIDNIDHHILTLLQEDARLSNAALAEQVGLTASSVYERVKKLEKKGIIKQYVAIVDPQALGQAITAFIRITIGAITGGNYHTSKQQFVKICLAEPAVLECHSVAGEDCYILKVRVSTPDALEKLIERLRSQAFVVNSISSIVLSTLKETTKTTP